MVKEYNYNISIKLTDIYDLEKFLLKFKNIIGMEYNKIIHKALVK